MKLGVKNGSTFPAAEPFCNRHPATSVVRLVQLSRLSPSSCSAAAPDRHAKNDSSPGHAHRQHRTTAYALAALAREERPRTSWIFAGGGTKGGRIHIRREAQRVLLLRSVISQCDTTRAHTETSSPCPVWECWSVLLLLVLLLLPRACNDYCSF